MTASAESPNQSLPQGTGLSEEPSFAVEPDLPSDGRDEVGEAMIRDLPRRPELSESPSPSGFIGKRKLSRP